MASKVEICLLTIQENLNSSRVHLVYRNMACISKGKLALKLSLLTRKEDTNTANINFNKVQVLILTRNTSITKINFHKLSIAWTNQPIHSVHRILIFIYKKVVTVRESQGKNENSGNFFFSDLI